MKKSSIYAMSGALWGMVILTMVLIFYQFHLTSHRSECESSIESRGLASIPEARELMITTCMVNWGRD